MHLTCGVRLDERVCWEPKEEQGFRRGSLEFAAHGRRLAQGVHHRLRRESVVDIRARAKVHNPAGSSTLPEGTVLCSALRERLY